jgi:hypothetical protein
MKFFNSAYAVAASMFFATIAYSMESSSSEEGKQAASVSNEVDFIIEKMLSGHGINPYTNFYKENKIPSTNPYAHLYGAEESSSSFDGKAFIRNVTTSEEKNTNSKQQQALEKIKAKKSLCSCLGRK